MSVVSDDGAQRLDIGPAVSSGEEPVFSTPYLAAERMVFDVCPICLSDDVTSKEHVGPKAIGGAYMTKTCARCNNELGSRLDKPLAEWTTSSYERMKVTSPLFPGPRNLKRVSTYATTAGQPVWFLRGDPGPDVRAAFASTLESKLWTPRIDLYRVQFAALKNAYLAAALFTESIPEGDDADEIRRLLVTVRDQDRDAPLPESPLVRNLLIARSKTPPDGHPVTLIAMTTLAGARSVGVSFSGVLSTSWPLSVPVPMEPWDEIWDRRPKLT